jgi:hypothetical protein
MLKHVHIASSGAKLYSEKMPSCKAAQPCGTQKQGVYCPLNKETSMWSSTAYRDAEVAEI